MPRELIRKLFSRETEIEEAFLSQAVPIHYPIPELGFDLTGYQLSVYSEAWDAQIVRSRRHGIIIANNTYLSSFAYNMAAVWVNYGHEYDRLMRNEACQLAQLLTYNLKKFFAEQIMRRSDCVFGSAIFLETLFYEEELMVPVFQAAERDERLGKLYTAFKSLMSSLLLFHEVGHIVRDKRSDMLQLMGQDIGLNTLGDHWKEFDEKLQIEFECDAFAALMMVSDQSLELSQETKLRGIVFAFAVFASMIHLDRSAQATANEANLNPLPEDLDNVFAAMAGASYSVGVEPFAVARAQSVRLIIQHVAEQKGIHLYETDGELPIYPDMVDTLSSFSTNIIERDNPSYRPKCELLARALRGNPRGIRYLRLRSKRFEMPQS